MSDFLQTLNPRQREAVEHDGGALALAGAGTGKTRVLTGRIVRLLTLRLAAPHQILAVTFTNKAAQEMRKRVEAEAAGMAGRGLWLGTFHGIAHRLLRLHAQAAGMDKNFQILDSQDQLNFLRRLFRERGIGEDIIDARAARNAIVAAKEQGLRAADMPRRAGREAAVAQIYALYEAACKQENKADFGELLLASLEMLRNNAQLREHYASRFRHILIDELQDTGEQQFEWLGQFDSGDNQFFGVGDDDQSIYAFRGARPRVMQEFQSARRAHKLIRLEENYRSGKSILAAANKLISHNRGRLGKTLRATAQDDEKIKLFAHASDMEEADNIANHLGEALEGGANANEAAVLYRTNAQARLFERALMLRGVPYRVYGGLRFYDRAEVKHALAYMRLAAADDRDALLRVINTPTRGIGEKTLAQLAQANGGVFAALQAPPNNKVKAFAALLASLRAVAEGGATPGEVARAAVEKSGLLDFYKERNEQERGENLRELVSAATQFGGRAAGEADEETTPLQAFLAMAALEGSADMDADGKDGAANAAPAANLMTVHAAKGLEFERVYIVGLEEGLFPHAQSLDSSDAGDLEEERRLMYVAMTRAKRKLFLSYARQRMTYGKIDMPLPSRFLRETPAEQMEAPPPAPAAVAAANNKANAAPAKPRATPLPPRDGKFRPGDGAQHPKYGAGVVLRCKGSGNEAEAEIMFKKIGIKSFKVALAPLTKVS